MGSIWDMRLHHLRLGASRAILKRRLMVVVGHRDDHRGVITQSRRGVHLERPHLDGSDRPMRRHEDEVHMEWPRLIPVMVGRRVLLDTVVRDAMEGVVRAVEPTLGEGCHVGEVLGTLGRVEIPRDDGFKAVSRDRLDDAFGLPWV